MEDILAAFSQIWAGSSLVGLNPGFVQFSTFNTVYRRVGVFIGWNYTNHHVCLSVCLCVLSVCLSVCLCVLSVCLTLCPAFVPKICSELICGVLHLWSCFLVSVCLSVIVSSFVPKISSELISLLYCNESWFFKFYWSCFQFLCPEIYVCVCARVHLSKFVCIQKFVSA